MRAPDYENFIAVLERQSPKRDTLFELLHADKFYEQAAGPAPSEEDVDAFARWNVQGWAGLGYDFINCYASELSFPSGPRKSTGSSISLNEGSVISDWASFEAYPWPDPDACDDQFFQAVLRSLPEGMKANVFSRGGVFENVTQLVGFDNTCILLYEDPELIGAVFQKVGDILVRYYKKAAQQPQVGAIIVSDDWGHKTQTMISPQMMRKYVFPHYAEINDFAHGLGKYAILHSCGNLRQVMDDVIDGLKFDAKHSYEDVIQPVEDAYEEYGSRIAILGGIDMDYVCQHTLPEIRGRACAMLNRTRSRGGYALGTGNTAADFVPTDHFLALIRTATESQG